MISIILPVYNGEIFLSTAIDSILKQTYSNFELIIVNDGSNDGTEDIVLNLRNCDPRVIYIPFLENSGLPASLNHGIKIAKGNYITWTSHDNILMPNALEYMLHELVNTSSDFVYADCLVVNEKGEETGFLKAKPIENILFSNVVHACFLYRREVYKNVGEYDSDLKLIEDWDYWLRCAQKCKMTNISQTLYQFRHHDSSLTSQIKTERLKKKLFENNKYKMLENLVSDKRIRNKELVIEFFLNTDHTIYSVLSKDVFPTLINEIKYFTQLFPALSSRRVRYVIANRIYDFIVRKSEYHDLRLINLITTGGFLIKSLPPVRTAVLLKKALLR